MFLICVHNPSWFAFSLKCRSQSFLCSQIANQTEIYRGFDGSRSSTSSFRRCEKMALKSEDSHGLLTPMDSPAEPQDSSLGVPNLYPRGIFDTNSNMQANMFSEDVDRDTATSCNSSRPGTHFGAQQSCYDSRRSPLDYYDSTLPSSSTCSPYDTLPGFSPHQYTCENEYQSELPSPVTASTPAWAWSPPPSNFMAETSRGHDFVPQSMIDGIEETDDKPYARLIYEALMQAPGHRMMLREIYSWFQSNTNKPRESGTNGWQNSIRHNLSMNQVREIVPECAGKEALTKKLGI